MYHSSSNESSPLGDRRSIRLGGQAFHIVDEGAFLVAVEDSEELPVEARVPTVIVTTDDESEVFTLLVLHVELDSIRVGRSVLHEPYGPLER